MQFAQTPVIRQYAQNSQIFFITILTTFFEIFIDICVKICYNIYRVKEENKKLPVITTINKKGRYNIMKKVQIELTSKPYDMGDGTYLADCSIEGIDSTIEFVGFMGHCTRYVSFIYLNCYGYENAVDMKMENEDQENFDIINFDEFVSSIFGF